MNKSLLKFVTDFGPLLIFFYFYKTGGNNLSIAIPPLIIATILAVVIVYVIEMEGLLLLLAIGFLTYYFIRHPLITISVILKVLGLLILGTIGLSIIFVCIVLIGHGL